MKKPHVLISILVVTLFATNMGWQGGKHSQVL